MIPKPSETLIQTQHCAVVFYAECTRWTFNTKETCTTLTGLAENAQFCRTIRFDPVDPTLTRRARGLGGYTLLPRDWFKSGVPIQP